MMGKLWNQNRKQFVAWFLNLKAIVADSNDINKTTAAKLEAKAKFFHSQTQQEILLLH